MKSVCLEIADLRFLIRGNTTSLSRLLDRNLKDFVSDGRPDIVINIKDTISHNISKKDLSIRYKDGEFMLTKIDSKFEVSSNFGRLKLGMLDRTTGEAYFNDYGEDSWQLFEMFLRACLHVILASDGFMFHTSGVAYDGKGYLFSGPSGSGKTTIASLSPGAVILSDDCVCIRKIKGSFFIYGTPWGGSGTGPVALSKIFFIKKGKKTMFEGLTPQAAFKKILTNIFFKFLDDKSLSTLLDIVADLSLKTPSYIMRFSLNSNIREKIEQLN